MSAPFHEPSATLPDEAHQLWEVNAAWWQEWFTEGADPEYREQIVPLLRELLIEAAPATVLDIGCGEGQLSRVSARLAGVRLVVGVDPTRAQLEAALRRQPPTSARSRTSVAAVGARAGDADASDAAAAAAAAAQGAVAGARAGTEPAAPATNAYAAAAAAAADGSGADGPHPGELPAGAAPVEGPEQAGPGPVMYARATATALPFPDGSFDAAFACLVFEHIEDVAAALTEAGRALVPGGTFVLFMNHPLLQAPGSGWVDDDILGEQYWRIGPYLAENHGVEEVDKNIWIPFIHRPLSVYVNGLVRAGLYVTRMLEPPPPEGFLQKAAEYRRADAFPRLMVLVAKKLPNVPGPRA
ncbi:MAG TPA: methyltransferase domain-containing protein [Acidimicrobiales bacterium]|nr:methyltransferase domain-containing protein [Acidimicrobiales bacterium]